MDIAKTSILYFSPTDSTKKIMEMIGGVIDKKADKVDITDYQEKAEKLCFSSDELLMIGVPVYGGRVPETAVERLKCFKGNQTPAVLVVTYGNRAYDDALLELKNIVQENGFIVIAAAAFVTEHSIMHSFGNGRPNEKDREEIATFAEGIKDKVTALKVIGEEKKLFVKGDADYREYKGVPLKPKAGNKCNQCGECARKCPVHAIPLQKPLETLTDICISCMRCVKICPQHARGVNKIMIMAAGKKMEASCKEAKQNEIFIH